MQIIRNLTLLLAALGICAAQTATAATQEYPSRPIRLIIPNAAGAAVDTLGRIFANTLTQVSGQQFAGCYYSFAPDPWSGVNRSAFINTKTGYRVLTETRWSE